LVVTFGAPAEEVTDEAFGLEEAVGVAGLRFGAAAAVDSDAVGSAPVAVLPGVTVTLSGAERPAFAIETCMLLAGFGVLAAADPITTVV
jgi:hypothetical protein